MFAIWSFHSIRMTNDEGEINIINSILYEENRLIYILPFSAFLWRVRPDFFQYPIKYKNTSENKCRIVESHRELLSSTIYTHLLAGRCHRSQTIATQPANNNRGLRKCRKFIPSWSVRSCTVTHCQQQTNTDIICFPNKWINAFFMCAVAVIRRLYFFYIINILLLLLFLLLLVPWFMIRQIWQWPCFVCLLHACALCVFFRIANSQRKKHQTQLNKKKKNTNKKEEEWNEADYIILHMKIWRWRRLTSIIADTHTQKCIHFVTHSTRTMSKYCLLANWPIAIV